MLRLRDIMTTDVITMAPETTVREAMEVLARAHVSGAPVLSGESLVGVITATDLMAFASGLPSESSGVEDDQPTLDDEPEMEDAGVLLDEPGGVFFSELWSVGAADAALRISDHGSLEWNALENHTVSEAMTTGPLITLPDDATAESAAELMRERGIHRVLVTERGQLIGIVSALDIAAAAADHRFAHRTYLFNNDAAF